VLLCFIKLQFKPKCHGIDTIMYNSWSVGHQSLVNSAQLFVLFVPMGGCPRHVMHAGVSKFFIIGGTS
jgi:hypothetical protein